MKSAGGGHQPPLETEVSTVARRSSMHGYSLLSSVLLEKLYSETHGAQVGGRMRRKVFYSVYEQPQNAQHTPH